VGQVNKTNPRQSINGTWFQVQPRLDSVNGQFQVPWLTTTTAVVVVDRNFRPTT